MEHLQKVINQFPLKGTIQKIIPFGNGHIHDSYRLINSDANKPDYLLQRINHQVFKLVDHMMNNIHLVTQHLRANNISGNKTLEIIPNKDGHLCYQDLSGNYWRLYLFLKELYAYDLPQNINQIFEGAKSFGTFLRQLSNFPPQQLTPSIPDFHNVVSRLELLQIACKNDIKRRAKLVSSELKYIEEMADQMCTIQRMNDIGKIPNRVTHNDTKFNNVLLDKNDIGICVVDLDTVMPGIVHYDYGDGIRTTSSFAAEDEADLQNIQIDLERLKAFTNGYLSVTRTILNPTELHFLPLAGTLMAYIMGVRFLTDYLEGDHYYKTKFDGHNLQRAKAQLCLCKRLHEQENNFRKHIFS